MEETSEVQENLRRALWQNNTKLDILVSHTFSLLWALQEWDIQNISMANIELAQELLEISTPSDSERIVPASEDGISGLDFQARLSGIASKSAGGHITNNIGKVWIQGTNSEWETHLLQGGRLRVDILLLRPLNTVELFRQVCRMVVQGIALLKCNVSSPVADLDITLKTGNQSQWPGKLVSHTDCLCYAGWNLAKWSVLQLRACLHWETRTVRAFRSSDLGILKDIAGRKLDVCLLFQGRVR